MGVIFDEKPSFIPQINSLCKSANLSLYKIKSIRKLITHKTCKILIHSLVLSRLYYVNSLYNRLPKCKTNKIDNIIISYIRIIHNIKFNNHISISSLQHKLQILSLKDRAFPKSILLVHNLIYLNTICINIIYIYIYIYYLKGYPIIDLSFPLDLPSL